MRIEAQDYNDVTVLVLQGDLDGDFVEMFRKAITEAVARQKKGIALDMTSVSFIDSQGLEQLLWARDYCNENKCQLRLAGLDENCRKILEITRLDNEFDCYTELAEAAKSFA